MQRVLSTVTLLGLLVATAAAFAITEHLKQIKSPVYATRVTGLISPVCGCATAKAAIGVELRRRDRVTVTIENAGGQTVATLKTDVSESKGPASFVWDGRTDAGAPAADGPYEAQIHLFDSHRKILLPNRIVVDTTPPKVLEAKVPKGPFSPLGNRTIPVDYVLGERAHVALYLRGRRLTLGRTNRTRAAVNWNGTEHGKPLPEGRYVLSVGAVDLAGNVTPSAERKDVVVTLRFVALSHARIHARPGARFSVGVRTGAKRYGWRLDGRRGRAHGKELRLRAPAKRGTYRLVVTAGGHSATAKLIVGRG